MTKPIYAFYYFYCLPVGIPPQQAAQDLNSFPALTVVGSPGNIFHVRAQRLYDIVYAADDLRGQISVVKDPVILFSPVMLGSHEINRSV